MSVSSTITAIIPVYKAEPYLAQCLESLLAQTHQAWEAICVDDGSPDASGAILDAYAAKDARIRVIHQSNAGVAAARNAALDQCRTEYVTMIDADDWVEAEMFEHMLQLATTTQADLVQVGLMHNTDDGRPLHPFVSKVRSFGRVRHEKISLRALCRLKICAVIKLFRRDIIERHHLRYPFGQSNGEDSAFLYHYLAYSRMIVTCPKALYHVRDSRTSVTQKLYAGQLDIETCITNYMTPARAFEFLKTLEMPVYTAETLRAYYLYQLCTERISAMIYLKPQGPAAQKKLESAYDAAIAEITSSLSPAMVWKVRLYSVVENFRGAMVRLVKRLL